jgi:Rubredoxin-like zinc ribbon domain (DUF35_N)
MSYAKPLPVLDAETQPFWDACRRGKLVLQRCKSCGHTRFPPTRFCSKCRSANHDWIESKGLGRVSCVRFPLTPTAMCARYRTEVSCPSVCLRRDDHGTHNEGRASRPDY